MPGPTPPYVGYFFYAFARFETQLQVVIPSERLGVPRGAINRAQDLVELISNRYFSETEHLEKEHRDSFIPLVQTILFSFCLG